MVSPPSSAPLDLTWTWRLFLMSGHSKFSHWGRCIRCVQTLSKVSSYWNFNWTNPYQYIFNAPTTSDVANLMTGCNSRSCVTWPGEWQWSLMAWWSLMTPTWPPVTRCQDPARSDDRAPSCASVRWCRARCQEWCGPDSVTTSSSCALPNERFYQVSSSLSFMWTITAVPLFMFVAGSRTEIK